MMVIYLPVKFEFDWTKRFQVRVQKRKRGRTDGETDIGHINLIGGLVTCKPPKTCGKFKGHRQSLQMCHQKLLIWNRF